MSCYHPLKAFQIGVNLKTNKPIYKVTSFKVDYIWKQKNSDSWKCETGEPYYLPNTIVKTNWIEIPCGKCIGCRLKYSRDWANRCMLEAQQYEHNYFVTLTYDDNHVPTSSWYDEDTGEVGNVLTLSPDDLQKFMKRLRKRYENVSDEKIRFFACGEYGSTTMRPHYHLILFNLKLDDLKVYKQSKHGFNYYNSNFLDSCWKKGHVIVADVSWESCAYVARYVMKKANGATSAFYKKYNMVPEFVRMSRKPGIARNYLDTHMHDIYKTDKLVFSTLSGAKMSKPPRYYDKIFEEECPEAFANVKENRKTMAEALTKLKLENTDLDYLQLLAVEEENKNNQIKALHREL